MSKKLILVTGATGKQGGSVVRHLLERRFAIRALTRNPETRAAQLLKAKGVDVVKGDLEDAQSLHPALKGAYGVFSVQNFWEKGVGYEGEVRQARNLAEAAREQKVHHFVQSSIAECDVADGVRHFESKGEIEKVVDSFRLPRTFIRTVLFMENFADPKFGKMMFAVLGGSLKPETRLHMLAVDDIGWFAATAFAKPKSYLGKTIDIAGDSLSLGEIKETYSRVTGKQAPGFKIPSWMLKMMNGEMSRQLRWNNDTGWRFDLKPLRKIHPGLISFEKFLKTHFK